MGTEVYKQKALENLKGHWFMSVLTGFLALFFTTQIRNMLDIDFGDHSISVANAFVYYLGQGWEVKTNPYLLLVSEQQVISIAEEIVFAFAVVSLGIAVIKFILSCIIGGYIELGYAFYHLKLYDGEAVSVKDLFGSFQRFKQGLGLYWIRTVYIFLWTLLLVIPGIIAEYSYAMAPYILQENPELTPSEALSRSKEMMKGHKFELFWLEVSFFGWIILSAFTLGIGIYFLEPYMKAAETAFYREISNQQKEEY